jgi:hypothetical protein
MIVLILLFAAGITRPAQAQDRRVVTQPTTPAPHYCRVLRASLPALSPTAFVPPRVDGDGVVTGHDVAVCATRCRHAACAP